MFEKMPKLPGDDEKYLRKKLDDLTELDQEMDRQKQSLVDTGREIVGHGSESIVEVHPSHPDKVAAHSFRDEGPRMRRIFYNHRVLHTLFPDFFPVVHAAFEQSDEKRGGTVRERVDVQMIPSDEPGQPITPKSFENVRNELRSMGIDSNGFDTGSANNFGVAWDGYEQYLDVNVSVGKHFVAHKDEVVQYMKTKKYTEVDIEKVISAIARLEVLEQEAKDNGEDQRVLQ